MLAVNLAGISLDNPLILASGFLGISQEIFTRLYHEFEVGAIVSKSISLNPMEGYRGPTVVPLENFNFLNAVGLSNPGSDSFSNEIKNNDVPLLVSLVGSQENEFPKLIKKFDKLCILGYEVNLSCPHVAKMGMEVGDDIELVYRIIKRIKSVTTKPVIIKIGIGNTNIVKIAEIAQDAGANAITAINTIRAMKIDIKTERPILSNKFGGLSGKAIKPIGIRSVYEISKNLNIPVVGCGGIFSWEDVIEYMLAGSSAVQIGSSIGYLGMSVFKEIKKGIMDYIKKKDLKNIMEIIGNAHKY
ncbi:MAG: dihydroorotate dehydrogenase [Nitrososphaeraceae archaeon]|nr:dihydroorotate dehydrogenase [Nitrososphaeraceae archaeon]